MNSLAYLMLDGPVDPAEQLQLSVFLPAASIVVSWIAIRTRRWLVLPAGILAVVSGLLTVASLGHPINRSATLDEFGHLFVAAVYLSAVLPVLAVAAFVLDRRRGDSSHHQSSACADREGKEDKKAAEPGATDNPDDAQRLREDH